jgi:hypothetical protein
MPVDHPVAQFWSYVHQGLAALNVNFGAVLHLEDKMREAGFVNISVRVFSRAHRRVAEEQAAQDSRALLEGDPPPGVSTSPSPILSSAPAPTDDSATQS